MVSSECYRTDGSLSISDSKLTTDDSPLTKNTNTLNYTEHVRGKTERKNRIGKIR
jgi:hypothetical protein